jgi:hypothetical protein
MCQTHGLAFQAQQYLYFFIFEKKFKIYFGFKFDIKKENMKNYQPQLTF